MREGAGGQEDGKMIGWAEGRKAREEEGRKFRIFSSPSGVSRNFPLRKKVGEKSERRKLIRAHLVSWSQPMECAHLVRREGLAKQVDGGHLAPEDPLLVYVWGGTDVALVERLGDERGCFGQTAQTNWP